ncbi:MULTISPECIES: phosphopantetheine-binding protein [Kitasatospora]|uniref:phosphopantetheine-binding protein n=1 Tax=Kitasatospora TaxID=2063 RepID=UPI000C2C3EF7|nr:MULTISPECIES: phosphopantetheine-binding protein [Kitasatospora]RAJ43042.1 acyl carrier protein [Kitasatospora sp. SolWspMP-SS2h]
MTDTIETTDRTRVVAAITEALGAVLQRDLGDLAPDTKLFDTLGLDSTGVLDLLLRLEELLDGEFDTDELEMSHFATVRSLADFITAELDA